MGIEDDLKLYMPASPKDPEAHMAKLKYLTKRLDSWGIDLSTKTADEKKNLLYAANELMKRSTDLGLPITTSPDELVAKVSELSTKLGVGNNYDSVLTTVKAQQKAAARVEEMKDYDNKKVWRSEVERDAQRGIRTALANKYHTKSNYPDKKEVEQARSTMDIIESKPKYSVIKAAIDARTIENKNIPKAIQRADEKEALIQVAINRTLDPSKTTKNQLLHKRSGKILDFFRRREVLTEINPAADPRKDHSQDGPGLKFMNTLGRDTKKIAGTVWNVGVTKGPIALVRTLLQLNKELKGGGDKK